MATSRRNVNWTSTSWSQTKPTVATSSITGVQGVSIARNPNVIRHSGDGDYYDTVIAMVGENPVMTITHRDIAAQATIPMGARGTMSAVHNDAKNGVTTGNGGYTVALLGMISESSWGGEHRAFGQGSIAVTGESTDGATNPLSFTAL